MLRKRATRYTRMWGAHGTNHSAGESGASLFGISETSTCMLIKGGSELLGIRGYGGPMARVTLLVRVVLA